MHAATPAVYVGPVVDVQTNNAVLLLQFLISFLSVDLLRKCIMIRDSVFTLPDFYTVADVQSIILYTVGHN